LKPKRFNLKALFNKLTGLLGIRALFNWFARPRGPRPEPIQIDPAWFPVPQPTPAPADEWLPPGLVPPKPHLPPWEPPWVAMFDPPWVPPWELMFAAQPEATELPGAYWEADDPEDYPYPEDALYDYECDPYAFAEDNPDWADDLPDPEPEDDDIYVRPGEKVPFDAGELLRSYYVVGVGDVHVFARIHPDEMDLHPDQIIEPGELRQDFNLHFRPKGPKPSE
tara:strand:- start:17748 stop:18416 length:669 start_codon:yes stop_codon:yes gene_type:complete